MILDTTPYFRKSLAKKTKKNPKLEAKIGKQIKLLLKDFRHSSLKTHKLVGKRADQYSIWIEDNLRITFKIIGDTIFLVDIVTHDEY